jgi:hypothetical protein
MKHIEVPDGPELSDDDVRCLQDALALYRSTSRARSDWIDAVLATRTWFDVAIAAVAACQTRALALKPWILPPVYIDLDGVKPGQEVMGRLLARMLAANVSRYAPDPMAALAAAEERVGSSSVRQTEAAATLTTPSRKARRRPSSASASP